MKVTVEEGFAELAKTVEIISDNLLKTAESLASLRKVVAEQRKTNDALIALNDKLANRLIANEAALISEIERVSVLERRIALHELIEGAENGNDN